MGSLNRKVGEATLDVEKAYQGGDMAIVEHAAGLTCAACCLALKIKMLKVEAACV